LYPHATPDSSPQWDVGLAVFAYELDDEALFSLTQEWFDRAHDPLPDSDRQPITDLDRFGAGQMPGRHDLIAATKLIPILDAAHQTRPHPTRPARRTLQPAAPQVPSSLATGICYSRARQLKTVLDALILAEVHALQRP
jgi:hypothetical protein